MSKKALLKISAVVLFYVVMPSNILAQVYYSSLTGTVRDQSGAAVPGAEVTAIEISTGVTTTIVTDDVGGYRLSTLRPGEYTVTTARSGFKKNTIENIKLNVSETTRVDISLEVGSIDEQVVIFESSASLVQSESAERGAVLAHREVEALPLSSRNMSELTYLVPGAVKAVGFLGTPMPSVNGLSQEANQFYVDGGGLTSGYFNLPVERISIDTIEEFRVETSNTSADHGLHAGATISIATKHGTNEFHGTLFEFFRNDALNARSFFAQSKPSLRYNQFGGTLGGPIIKNKLFFQGTYEGSVERRALTLTATVPTLAERQGDFTPGTGTKTATIYNPFDLDPVTGLRRPFPNNKIPESMINPIAKRYLSLWPSPNRTGFPNFIYNAPSKTEFHRYNFRLDYTASQKNSFMLRIGHQTNPVTQPGPIPGAATGRIGQLFGGRNLVASWNHSFSPTVINIVRFSYANLAQRLVPSEFFGENISGEFGFANGDRISQEVWGCPRVGFSGVSTNAVCNTDVWTFPNKTYYFSDDLTFIRGSHTFKTGLLHLRYLMDTVYGGQAGGVSNTFTGRYTTQIGDLSGGQPFADFLLGALGGLSINENAQIAPDRRNVWQMYFQDDWKVNSKLTLQLGLRYDLNLPPTIANNRAGAWLDGLESRRGQTIVFPRDAEGELADVLKGNPLGFPFRFSDNNWLAKPTWNNFGPRIGIAYRPFGDAKTVIRGGYGIYYDLMNGGLTNNRSFGRPFYTFDSTQPRPVVFESPPFRLGEVPILTPGFKPGELFRSGYVASPHMSDNRVQQWNITFQRELGKDFAVEIAYVGNRNDRGPYGFTWNRTYPVGYTFNYEDGTTFTITESTPLLERKKYPDLQTGTSVFPLLHGSYHALQTHLTKRFSHGIQFRVGYTRSRSYGIDSFLGQDEANFDKLSYRRANDLPNVFFATYVIQLPGNNLPAVPRAILGGWQLAGIVNLQSGAPVFVFEAFPQFPGAAFEIAPVLLRNPNLPSSERTLARWFDTDAFQQPFPNQFGSDEAIRAVRADSLQNFDIALSKYIFLTESHRIQLRAEFFNVFNHPTFGAPGGGRGTATFGRVSSAGPGREIQLGIKYQF